MRMHDRKCWACNHDLCINEIIRRSFFCCAPARRAMYVQRDCMSECSSFHVGSLRRGGARNLHHTTSWNDSTANHLSNENISVKKGLFMVHVFISNNLLGEVVFLRLKVPFTRYSACSLKSDTCI